MTDMEFVSLFRIEELPECSEGLWLLKQWVESDPVVVDQLREMQQLDLERLSGGDSAIFQKLAFHLQTCPPCSQLLQAV